VAQKKAQLTQAKLDLRLREREMRARLRELKAELKEARQRDRQGVPTRPSIPAARPAPAPPPPLSGDRLKEELRRLKALHSQGAIDGAAYENARIALLQPHLRS
jgi:multidrug resistance efflux pump